jgi:hypothetical protein
MPLDVPPCIHGGESVGIENVTQKHPRAMKVMKLLKQTQILRQAAFGALAAFGLGINATQAADHGDAPVASNNQNGDIADVYAFLDPNDNDQVVLIATIRGFIAAGENSNFGIFDPNIRYHFEIENNGNTKTDKSIDVTFTPRTAIDGPAGKENLQIPQAQKATVTFTNFKDATGKKLKSFSDLDTTPSSTASSAPAQVVDDLGTTGIKFFAGMVDDPFFFDIPATGAFITSVRNGAPDPTAFNRARDSFAGYNVMGIALRIPATLLRGDGTSIGVVFYSQRKLVQNPNKKTGDIKGTGAYRTIDRMGNPAVNVVLIPFNRKNEYNQATPKDDANLKFAVDILKTLKALGTTGTGIDDQGNFTGLENVTGTALTLAQVAVLNGDYLRLDTDKTAKPNTGTGGGDNAGSGFPNGRRLRDDVVDIELTLIANGTPLGDNVNASDPLPNNTFPFLAQPNQPFPNGTLDDKTRN